MNSQASQRSVEHPLPVFHQPPVRILVWSGLMLLSLPGLVLAQNGPLKGGVEQTQIRPLPSGSDAYLTDGKCMATCGAANEWFKSNYSPETRKSTSTCLSLLDNAHGHEEAMIAAQNRSDEAAKAHEYRRRDDLIKQMHDESILRSKDLQAFGDCLKRANLASRQGSNQRPAPKTGQVNQSGGGTDDAGGRLGGPSDTGGGPTSTGSGSPNRPSGGGTGGSVPTGRTTPPTGPQSVPNFSNQLLADAQTLLQNAGRISKAMTEAMDVTKHNNVGIGVAVSGYFGASTELLGLVAQQYKLLAVASNAVAAEQKAPILVIANEAASESGTLANQADQTVSQLGARGGATGGAPLGSGTGPAGSGGINYQEGMAFKGVAGMPGQGALPICGVLSCARIAQLLQRNIPTLRAFSVGIGPEGLTAAQIAANLQKAGINAEVGTGMTNMMNAVRAGTPVIAGLKTTAAADSLVHAVVIEGLETQGGVAGLNIYDPRGFYYWQPIKSFAKYFTNNFIRPI